MQTAEEVTEEVFSRDLLFDFSEAFERNKKANLRRSVELVFLDTCREFHIFGDRQKKFFEVFAVYRTTVRIPEGIMERARFLPEEEPPRPKMPPASIEPVPVKKVSSLTRITTRNERPDRHESQLPKGDLE